MTNLVAGTKVNINLINEKLLPKNHKFVKLVNDSVSLKELDKLKGKRDLVLHYLINNRREINSASKELISYIEELSSISNLTVVLQIPIRGLNNLLLKDLHEEMQSEQDLAETNMEVLKKVLNKNDIKFISYTFDPSTSLTKEIISKSEYVVELEEEMNSTHYLFTQFLIYKKKI